MHWKNPAHGTQCAYGTFDEAVDIIDNVLYLWLMSSHWLVQNNKGYTTKKAKCNDFKGWVPKEWTLHNRSGIKKYDDTLAGCVCFYWGWWNLSVKFEKLKLFNVKSKKMFQHLAFSVTLLRQTEMWSSILSCEWFNDWKQVITTHSKQLKWISTSHFTFLNKILK